MKPKKFGEKLVLGKETISNLENNHLKAVNGGIDYVSNDDTQCNTRPCGTCGTCDSCPPCPIPTTVIEL